MAGRLSSGTPSRARTLGAMSLGALALAGCGGDDTSSGPVKVEKEGGPPSGEGGVELTEIGTFEQPLYVTQPPAGDDALYVVEQTGRVMRVPGDGGEPEVFLDLSDEVTVDAEQGLLSIAFAPDYDQSGVVYASYTDSAGDSRVTEYRAEDGTVDPASARDFFFIDDPYPNHNGGLLLFGPDGNLYLGMGDGGAKEDPDRTAQDLSQPLGKMLRFAPTPDADEPYEIPADNPFADDANAVPEIYSYGLRNPWRFSFDRENGDVWIGDVGQYELEEVDGVTGDELSGANFGWSAYEGSARFNEDQDAPRHIPPVLEYTQDEGGCSVTGGYVVRDRALESLYGRYLYGDFCAGELRSFTARPGRPARDDTAVGLNVSELSSFGEDREGHIYATSLSGPVYRLDPASE